MSLLISHRGTSLPDLQGQSLHSFQMTLRTLTPFDVCSQDGQKVGSVSGADAERLTSKIEQKTWPVIVVAWCRILQVPTRLQT